MEIKELCDLLEIKSIDKKEMETELCNKLAPIIMGFNADWHTVSFMATKESRTHRDLEYLKEKGLLYFHGDRNNNQILYKLTNKGVDAYGSYNGTFKAKEKIN